MIESPAGSGLYLINESMVEDPPGSGLYVVQGDQIEDPPGSGLYSIDGEIGLINHQPRLNVSLTSVPPYVEVLFESFAAGTVSVDVFRSVRPGVYVRIRGGVNVVVAGGLSRIDFEAPFGVPVSYFAVMYDAQGLQIGFTNTSVVTVDCPDMWVHNPLDPRGATKVAFQDTAARSIVRPVLAEMVYPLGSSAGVAVGGQRQGVRGVRLDMVTDTLEQADKLQAMLGDGERRFVPVLCVRVGAGDRVRLPRPFFAGVTEMSEEDMTYNIGGELIAHKMTGDEVSPPNPGIIVPLLTRADVNAAYATRAALNAAYETRLGVNRAYELAGTA